MIESANAIARFWWDWMVAMGWQVGLLIGIIGCIDWLARRWAWPQLRYALWSLVLLKLLVPPTLSLPSGIISSLRPAAEKTVAIADRGVRIADLHLGVDHGFVPTVTTSLPPNTASAVNPQSEIKDHVIPSVVEGPQLDWRVYVMSAWLLGVTGLGAFLAVRLRGLSRGRGETCEVPPVPESFYNRMSRCADRVGLRRLPRVVPTTRLANPAVFGMFRPILLMPVGYLGRLSRQDTEHVLLHEFCHIKRGDLFVHGVTLVLQIVYWFNPLLWLVRRHIHHLRELCCDASVANLLREDTPAYRETLLETARRMLAKPAEPGLGLLGLFEDSNCLLARLSWLTKPTWRYRRMKNLIVVVMAGLMAACLLPMAQAQQPAAVQESATVPHIRGPEGSQDMQDLQEQMQRLQEQMVQLRSRMAELNAARATVQHEASATGLFRSYAVKEGDTLARIAENAVGPEKSRIENAIARIREVNELSGDSLKVGQRLWVPARVPVPVVAMVPHVPGNVDVPAPPVAPHAPAVPASVDDLRASAELESQYSVAAIKPDARVRIRNEAGSVKIRAGEGPDGAVTARVKGKAGTEQEAAEIARKVQIQITPRQDVIDIGAVIPDEVRQAGRSGVEVSLEITLPRRTQVQVSQKAGSVKVSGMDGDVMAEVEAGSIAAQNLGGNVTLFTRAGSIDVSVPATASTKIQATTKVGAIKSDLPAGTLNITNSAVLKHGDVPSSLGGSATGTLGSGQHSLSLQTEVGSIKITSAGALRDEPQAKF